MLSLGELWQCRPEAYNYYRHRRHHHHDNHCRFDLTPLSTQTRSGGGGG